MKPKHVKTISEEKQASAKTLDLKLEEEDQQGRTKQSEGL
jgi:hypothetical protein